MNNYTEELKKLSSNEQKLKFLNSVNFKVNITKCNDKITLSIPNLEIESNGTSLDEVYSTIELKKNDYFKQMIQSEAENEICFPPLEKPAGIKQVVDVLVELLIQYKKFIIFLLVFLIILRISSEVGGMISYSKGRFNKRLKYNLEHVTPEKTKERMERIQRGLDFIRPYYVQLLLFNNDVELEVKKRIK